MCLVGDRIRKIKCDEAKPFCQKCVHTGRTCDGYETPFKLVTSHAFNSARTGGDVGLRPMQSSTEITLQDIVSLNRDLSTKTILDVKLDCDAEAKQILQASLIDPPTRHAVLSLRALRQDLETATDGPAWVPKQTCSYNYGLQQYSLALSGLATQISSASPDGLKFTLICCQVLISIEQVRGNFSAMGLHIIRGLKILREYRARPYFTSAGQLAPAHYSKLPFLDVFIIKLFAAPCMFVEPAATVDASGATLPDEETVGSCDLRKLAPDMRTELVKISASTLEFLSKVALVHSTEDAMRLLSEKASLLDSLEIWLNDLEVVQAETKPPGPESILVFFMRIFYLILKIVLLGVLDPLPESDTELREENDRLQNMANEVGERVKPYFKTCGGRGGGAEEMEEKTTP